jgi:dTDP-4-dehydrorhamnose reductase
MRILVTGAAGMLASSVVPELLRSGEAVFGSTLEVHQTDINLRTHAIRQLDVRDFRSVEGSVDLVAPDIVFHLAAETDVDRCEREPDHAYLTNTVGTENVALACQKRDIPLLYISTGGVFDGNKPEPYTEFDSPGPVSVHGCSKLHGEIAVQRLLRRHFIVRAGWMVGGYEIDKKFVYKIIEQLRQGQRELKVVTDKYGSPTFTKDFAANLLPLLQSERYGLYHMCNLGGASRYQIAVKIVELMGLCGSVTVRPLISAEFPLSAPRARSEMMHNYRLDLLGMNKMPRWESSLQDYVRSNVARG